MAVPDLSPVTVDLLAQHGIHLKSIDPLGAEVSGLDLRAAAPSPEVLGALEVAVEGPTGGVHGWKMMEKPMKNPLKHPSTDSKISKSAEVYEVHDEI